MQRTRTVAGSPYRSASEAWSVITQLLVDTLERSPNILEGTVAVELSPMAGLGAALVSSEILDRVPLILVAGDLELAIGAKGGDEAFSVDENLDPVVGGAKAPSNWILYLPAEGRTVSDCEKAAARSAHLSTGSPPRTAKTNESATATVDSLDAEALRRMGGR
jgi:hypothetical protein